MTEPRIGREVPPPDTLWLTPESSGLVFGLRALADEDAVVLLFRDELAGDIGLALPLDAAAAAVGGMQQVLDNLPYLRTENEKIANREDPQ